MTEGFAHFNVDDDLGPLGSAVKSIFLIGTTVALAKYSINHAWIKLFSSLLGNVWAKSPTAMVVTFIIVVVCVAEDATWSIFTFPKDNMYRWLLIGVLALLKTASFLAKTGILPRLIRPRNYLHSMVKKGKLTLNQVQFWAGVCESAIILGSMLHHRHDGKAPNSGEIFFALVVAMAVMTRVFVPVTPTTAEKPRGTLQALQSLRKRYASVGPRKCCILCGHCKVALPENYDFEDVDPFEEIARAYYDTADTPDITD